MYKNIGNKREMLHTGNVGGFVTIKKIQYSCEVVIDSNHFEKNFQGQSTVSFSCGLVNREGEDDRDQRFLLKHCILQHNNAMYYIHGIIPSIMH